MTSQADAMETTIPKGRTLRIQDGEGLELNVVAGCLWVTYEHDTVNTVLDPSDTLRVSRNGLTLVHALKEVQLRIAYPVEAGAPSLTLGGGYREVGRSVARSIFAEWLSGMRGRIALYELMPITEAIKDLIVGGAPVQELRARAQAQGMKTLRQAGIARVLEGTTTVDEMLRVTLA